MSAGTQSDAITALFAAITKSTNALAASGVHETNKASALRDLALAYRYAAGGQQPGGVHIEKS